MQIQVDTLRRTLSLLEPVVPRKTPLPACQHILVGEGRAVATNLEVSATVEVPEADGPPLCFPLGALDFLKGVPGHLEATVEAKDGKVLVSAGGQKAAFKTIDPDDFPPVPGVEAEHEGVMDGDILLRALQAAAPFAATEESRPVLTAICLTLGDSPRAVTADGHRLALEELPGRLPGEGNLLIPAGAVKPLAHLWKGAGAAAGGTGEALSSLVLVQRFMRLGWDRKHLRVNFGTATLVISLVQGSYPNYGQLIPNQFRSEVSFLAEDLARTVKALAPLAGEGSGSIWLEWEGDTLKASARAEGNNQEMVVSASATSPGRIAFNARYLAEYLAGKQGMVKLSAQGERGTALLTYRGKGNHLLMPMFVQWGTPSPYPPEPKLEPTPAGDTPPSVDMGEEAEVEPTAAPAKAKLPTRRQSGGKSKEARAA